MLATGCRGNVAPLNMTRLHMVEDLHFKYYLCVLSCLWRLNSEKLEYKDVRASKTQDPDCIRLIVGHSTRQQVNND